MILVPERRTQVLQVPVHWSLSFANASFAYESGNLGSVFVRGSEPIFYRLGFLFARPSGSLPEAKEKRIFRNPSTENRVKNGVYLTFSQKVRFFAIFRIIL